MVMALEVLFSQPFNMCTLMMTYVAHRTATAIDVHDHSIKWA